MIRVSLNMAGVLLGRVPMPRWLMVAWAPPISRRGPGADDGAAFSPARQHRTFTPRNAHPPSVANPAATPGRFA